MRVCEGRRCPGEPENPTATLAKEGGDPRIENQENRTWELKMRNRSKRIEGQAVENGRTTVKKVKKKSYRRWMTARLSDGNGGLKLDRVQGSQSRKPPDIESYRNQCINGKVLRR